MKLYNTCIPLISHTTRECWAVTKIDVMEQKSNRGNRNGHFSFSLELQAQLLKETRFVIKLYSH